MASLPARHALTKSLGGAKPPTPAGQSLAEAAFAYAKRRLMVVPLYTIRFADDGSASGCSCGDAGCKRPGAHPVAPAMRSPLRVRRYWARFPHANVGIDLAASRVVAVELAPSVSADRCGLTPSITFRRPDGGLTVIYKRPAGVGVRSFKTRSPRGLPVTVRATGFVVMPPSVASAKAVAGD